MENVPVIKFETPGVEEFQLPSNGLGDQNLVKLFVKPMTWNEEKLMTNKTLAKQGKIQEALMKACVVSGVDKLGNEVKSVDMDKLLLEDEYALLLFIRAISYGRKYNSKIECPDCGVKQDVSIDIETDVPVTIADPNTNPEIIVFLPNQKKNVVLRYPTKKDTSEDVYTMIPKLIKSVDGVAEALIPTWITTLIAGDVSELRQAIGKSRFGASRKIKFVCDNTTCGSFKEIQEVDLPITAEFFRV